MNSLISSTSSEEFCDDYESVNKKKNNSNNFLYSSVINGFDNPDFINNQNNQSIQSIQPHRWINDNVVDNCYNCQIPFSWINRKHHCRSCGRIFCSKCSNFYIQLPHNYIIFPDKPIDFKQFLKSKISHNFTNDLERVCLHCYEQILRLNTLLKYIEVFELLGFNIKILHFISLVNKKWKDAARTLIQRFREIQYLPCGQELSDTEKTMLWNNRYFLSGHSRLLVSLITTINWSHKQAVSEVLKIIKSPKNTNCYNLQCSKNCQSNFHIFDIIDLVSNIIPNHTIYDIISNELNHLTCDNLLIFLPHLIYYIRYEFSDIKTLSKMLISKCINQFPIHFINQFHWLLIINSSNHKYKIILEDFLNTMSQNINHDNLISINKSYNFIHILNNLPINPNKDTVIAYLKYMVKNHHIFDNDLYFPLDSSYKCIGFNYDSIDIKNSATSPIKIPILCEKNNKTITYNIIYKNEDVRTDLIIMNLIHLIDSILKTEEKLDCSIKKYKILPTSKNSGIIQIVDNADTLYNISQYKKLSILNYIMEHNPNSKIDEVRNIFIKSCAAYCVITYLLGIGDRHLDNIMVTEKGQLFHIDYSFAMGYEPKIITVPKIRITPDMLDAIGGEHSQGFVYFKELVSRIYKCLRKHYNIFINMLIILSDVSDKYDKNKIRNEIINRFLLGQTLIEAELDIVTHISESKSSHFGQNIVDFFHYHKKEQTVESVIDCANNISAKIYKSFWG